MKALNMVATVCLKREPALTDGFCNMQNEIVCVVTVYYLTTKGPSQ